MPRLAAEAGNIDWLEHRDKALTHTNGTLDSQLLRSSEMLLNGNGFVHWTWRLSYSTSILGVWHASISLNLRQAYWLINTWSLYLAKTPIDYVHAFIQTYIVSAGIVMIASTSPKGI
jgi:hypothetical protein